MLEGSVKVPDTLGSLEIKQVQLQVASAPMDDVEDVPTLEDVDENNEEDYVICAGVRRSPRGKHSLLIVI